MSFEIIAVDKKSPAEKCGIKPFTKLLEINGNKINDVLDYKFYSYDEKLIVKICGENDETYDIMVNKYEGQELGLNFETYLLDKAKSCSNKCIFCFIDQLPKNMRETLYFKDDDARLSFLMGNYISLTNLSNEDVDRIIKMRISPVNISVQTTNPELRVKMLANKNAGKALSIMKKFADNDIIMNCQLVICQDINDKEELSRSLYDLKAMYPAVNSISVVPAGITKHREGLYPLKPITTENAKNIIDITEEFSNICLKEFSTRLAFCGDELYIKAKKKLPPSEFYEDFTQFENGVGMLSLFCEEFISALEYEKFPEDIKLKHFSIATGSAAYPHIKGLLQKLCEKYPNIKGDVYEVKNEFFGASVSVAGLITGGDLINSLKGKHVGEVLFISENMLREGVDTFLDDVTTCKVQEELNVKIIPVPIDGGKLFDYILDLEIL